MNELQPTSEFLLYGSQDGGMKVSVLLEEETVWATQKTMAEVFGVEVPTINYHLKEIFKSGEVQEDTVIRIFLTTASDGKKYKTNFYNLDAIISVGYRVNSYQATQFRIWATRVLKEHLIKGFTLDDERLKRSGTLFGKDYFDELLERIREIRASERRFYQKITDIYARCSSDYDPKSPITTGFFATVQNKLEFAITGKTAAEIIRQRASSTKPNMGLTTWKEGPQGKIMKSDVGVAKNYLTEKELADLNHIVSMYLDYAELQARNQRLMKMKDWVHRLDAFLQFNEYDLLNNAGQVSAEVAKSFAEAEYEKYRVMQDQSYQSDFDRLLEMTQQAKPLEKRRKPRS